MMTQYSTKLYFIISSFAFMIGRAIIMQFKNDFDKTIKKVLSLALSNISHAL